MKQIFLLLSIAYFVACSLNTKHEDRLGPAHNIEDRGEDTLSCSCYYVIRGEKWLDDSLSSNDVPGGVSDCVDLHLWSAKKKKYFDKCCYVRFQLDGEMHAGCVGLTQEYLNDSTETIRRMEDGDRDIWTRLGNGAKIYQLDCSSSYLKYFSLAILLLLGFF
jgi:hypothetical protein